MLVVLLCSVQTARLNMAVLPKGAIQLYDVVSLMKMFGAVMH